MSNRLDDPRLYNGLPADQQVLGSSVASLAPRLQRFTCTHLGIKLERRNVGKVVLLQR